MHRRRRRQQAAPPPLPCSPPSRHFHSSVSSTQQGFRLFVPTPQLFLGGHSAAAVTMMCSGAAAAAAAAARHQLILMPIQFAAIDLQLRASRLKCEGSSRKLRERGFASVCWRHLQCPGSAKTTCAASFPPSGRSEFLRYRQQKSSAAGNCLQNFQSILLGFGRASSRHAEERGVPKNTAKSA